MHFQGFFYRFKDINGARNHEGDILKFGLKLLYQFFIFPMFFFNGPRTIIFNTIWARNGSALDWGVLMICPGGLWTKTGHRVSLRSVKDRKSVRDKEGGSVSNPSRNWQGRANGEKMTWCSAWEERVKLIDFSYQTLQSHGKGHFCHILKGTSTLAK